MAFHEGSLTFAFIPLITLFYWF